MKLPILFLSMLLLHVHAWGDAASPYAGQEQRAIKSLSPDEIADLLAGKGMGLAKAAELNRYPGPAHVLELALKLQLSPKQRETTHAIYKQMQTEATRIGRLIVEKERALDSAYARQDIGEAFLQTLVAEIARYQGELRFVHLRAHLQQRQVLTPVQIERYEALRGYTQGQSGMHLHQAH